MLGHLERRRQDGAKSLRADGYNTGVLCSRTNSTIVENVASLLLLHLVLIAGGAGGAEYDIESILISGGLLAVSGIVLSIFAHRSGNLIAKLFGLSSIVFAIAILVLINVMQWNPREADLPVCILIWVYASAAVPAAIFSIKKENARPFTPSEMDS